MRTNIVVIALVTGLSVVALATLPGVAIGIPAASTSPLTNMAAKPELTFHVAMDDIVQGSAYLWSPGTNAYLVGWTFSEDTARKWLSFRQAHIGEKGILVLGEYRTSPITLEVASRPAFQEIWLRNPQWGIIVATETEAKAIIADLEKR